MQIKTEKKRSVVMFISDKIDFKTRAIRRDKEEHFIIRKGSTEHEDKL